MNEEPVKYHWFQCSMCGKLFDTEEALHQHERRCATASYFDSATLFVR